MPWIFRRSVRLAARRGVAGAMALVLFGTTVGAPLAEANLWQERRQTLVGRRSSDSPSSPQYAALPSAANPLPVDDSVLNDYSARARAAWDSARAAATSAASARAGLPRWVQGLATPYADIEDYHIAPALARTPPSKLSASPSQPVVLLLQDVHNHVEAQANMARFLSTLRRETGVRLVGLEGSVSGFDHSRFHRLPDQAALAAASEHLLQARLISGPEHYGLTETGPVLVGVEDEATYLANVDAFRRSLPVQSAALASEGALSAGLDALKRAVYGPELMDFDQKARAYAEGASGLRDYLEGLVGGPVRAAGLTLDGVPQVASFLKVCRAEDSVDFARAERERASLIGALTERLDEKQMSALVAASLDYRLRRIGFADYYGRLRRAAESRGVRLAAYPELARYVAYAAAADSIDREALFAELARFEKELGARLAVRPEQKETLALAEDLRTLGRLVRHNFSSADWKAYDARRAELDSLRERIASAAARAGVRMPDAFAAARDVRLDAFADFYARAFDRNRHLVERLRRRMAETGDTAAVLVAGGFHTEGLRSILKEDGVSYVVLTPRLGRVDADDHYLDAFARGRTPLEKLLLGEKLFIRSPAASADAAPDGFEHLKPVFERFLTSLYGALEVAGLNASDLAAALPSVLGKINGELGSDLRVDAAGVRRAPGLHVIPLALGTDVRFTVTLAEAGRLEQAKSSDLYAEVTAAGRAVHTGRLGDFEATFLESGASTAASERALELLREAAESSVQGARRETAAVRARTGSYDLRWGVVAGWTLAALALVHHQQLWRVLTGEGLPAADGLLGAIVTGVGVGIVLGWVAASVLATVATFLSKVLSARVGAAAVGTTVPGTSDEAESAALVAKAPRLGGTHPELEDVYKKQVEERTPDHVKLNRLFDIENDKGEVTVRLKRAHLHPYHPTENPEGLGLWEWLADYEAEAKIATAGIRLTQNILYPWDTRNRINEVGVAFATLAKALVAQETYPASSLEKMAGGEVRYNTPHYVELIARIQAALGVTTHLPAGRRSVPIWMVSFLTFMMDWVGAEHVTSSHANSSFIATKDINNQGGQYLPEESLRFVAKIRGMFDAAERDGEFSFKVAPADDARIDTELMDSMDDGVPLYVDYLRNGVATDINLGRIRATSKPILIDNVGGSMYRTMTRVFDRLGVAGNFRWLHAEEDPFFHGIGKDLKDGKVVDYTQDTTIIKRDSKTGEVVSIPVMERIGYDALLRDRPVGTSVLMTDPDGDRLVTAQIEPSSRAAFLRRVGVDFLVLDDERILALYTPNQSFFLTMVYHAQSLKDAGLWDAHPRFMIMTTASSAAWREWAEKNGVQVLNVPVGFKEIAALMKKVEDQMRRNPGAPVVVKDVFGREVDLGVQPRMLFAGEESGGMIIGPEELIESRGGRTAIAMREKSAGEAMVIQAAMAAHLDSQGRYLSDYLDEVFKANDIKGKYDVRVDVVYYDQNNPDPDALKRDKKEGEARRTKNYLFYLSLALAARDGKLGVADVVGILNDVFAAQNLRFDDLRAVHFVGDGVFFQFPNKVLEIRPSGTDAKSKSYAMGDDKTELALFATALGEYNGDLTALHRAAVPAVYAEKGMDLQWDIYQEYYREGLPEDSYRPAPAAGLPEVVGVVREIKANERRVGLTPRGAGRLVARGARVVVERGAGEASGFTDEAYAAAGAELVDTPAEVFEKASLIKHVKELQPSEYALLRPDHTVFTYNHFEEDGALTRRSVAAGSTFVSYEKVVVDGKTPLLAPMSRIAGTLGAEWSEPAGKPVVVLGGGVAGEAAVKRALELGASVVTVTEFSAARRKELRTLYPKAVVLDSEDREAVRAALKASEVVVGAVYVKGKAPLLIGYEGQKDAAGRDVAFTFEDIGGNKTIVDISVDQGGNVAYVTDRESGAVSTAKTSHTDKFAVDAYGNRLSRVPNMPAADPRRASLDLEEATLPYLESLAKGLDAAVAERPELVGGISVQDGRVVDGKVSEAHAGATGEAAPAFTLDRSWEARDSSSEQGPRRFKLTVRSDDELTVVSHDDVREHAYPEDKVDFHGTAVLAGRHVLASREVESDGRKTLYIVATHALIDTLKKRVYVDKASREAQALPLSHNTATRELSRTGYRESSEAQSVRFVTREEAVELGVLPADAPVPFERLGARETAFWSSVVSTPAYRTLFLIAARVSSALSDRLGGLLVALRDHLEADPADAAALDLYGRTLDLLKDADRPRTDALVARELKESPLALSIHQRQMRDALEKNAAATAWVDATGVYLGSADVEIVDELDDDRLTEEAVVAGEGYYTADGNFLARSHPLDVARSEERTIVSSDDPSDKGIYNNWKAESDIRPALEQRTRGALARKKLYVVPFLMGPPGSRYSKVGFELTDSRYVAINAIRMAKVGRAALAQLGDSDKFIKGVHVTGDLEKLKRTNKDDDDRYFAIFPRKGEIWSFGSAYGGNALLMKKFLALRQAMFDGAQDGWLAEHMLILEAKNKKTGESKFIAAAFPSASGKTNLAMLEAHEALGDEYEFFVVGDDIAWMYVGDDGRLHAFNPEWGFFGVAPGTNEISNRNAMRSMGPGTKTLFTNIAYKLGRDPKTGRPTVLDYWWEEREGVPSDPENWFDWRGRKILDPSRVQDAIKALPKDLPAGARAVAEEFATLRIDKKAAARRLAELSGRPEDEAKSWVKDMEKALAWAHGNSRYTAWAKNAPSLSSRWRDTQGVPISAIFFGGRMSRGEPGIRQLSDHLAGIYDGFLMGVEATAAAEGKEGMIRWDPMAQRPFFSVREDVYLGNWRGVFDRLKVKPLIFHTNWFRRKGGKKDGRFLYPGYKYNSFLVKWALGRVEGSAEGVEHPMGTVPTAAELRAMGLDIPDADLEEYLSYDAEFWSQVAAERTAYLKEIESKGVKLPDFIWEQHDRFVAAVEGRAVTTAPAPSTTAPASPAAGSSAREYVSSLTAADTEDLVAIVGAGPAGLRAASVLLEKGYKILFIDRNRADVVSGQAALGIPPAGKQLGLKENLWTLGQRVLRGIPGIGKDYPRDVPAVHPDVRVLGDTDFGTDLTLQELEGRGIPVIVATGPQTPRVPTSAVSGEAVAGRDLDNVVSATSQFFRKINIDWLTRAKGLAGLKYSGKPWSYGRHNVVYGGGNVASDAALWLHENAGAGAVTRLFYRGPSWGMYNMTESYQAPLREAGIEIVDLVTLEEYRDEDGDGRVDHAVFRRHRITGLELDAAGRAVPLLNGNTGREVRLPAGRTMQDILSEAGAALPAGVHLREGVAYRVATAPTDKLVSFAADLAVEAIGDVVEPLEGLDVTPQGAFRADPATGRVDDRRVWVAGQALTQRGAVAPSFKSAVAAAEDLDAVLKAEKAARAPAAVEAPKSDAQDHFDRADLAVLEGRYVHARVELDKFFRLADKESLEPRARDLAEVVDVALNRRRDVKTMDPTLFLKDFEGVTLDGGRVQAQGGALATRLAALLQAAETLVPSTGDVNPLGPQAEYGPGLRAPPVKVHVVRNLADYSMKFIDNRGVEHLVFDLYFVNTLLKAYEESRSHPSAPDMSEVAVYRMAESLNIAAAFTQASVFENEQRRAAVQALSRGFAMFKRQKEIGEEFFQLNKEFSKRFHLRHRRYDVFNELLESFADDEAVREAFDTYVTHHHRFQYLQVPPRRFAGKVVYITGGGTGIGLEIAREYAKEGANVVISGRRAGPLQKTVQELRELAELFGHTSDMMYVTGDVANKDDVERIFGEIESRFGQLDILVNNAGTSGPVKALVSADLKAGRETIDIHLTGVWLNAVAAAKLMKKTGTGVIMNVATHFTEETPEQQRPYPWRAGGGYTPAQGAKNSLTRDMGEYFKQTGYNDIFVVGSNPGPVHSDRIYGTVYPKGALARVLVAGHPFLRPWEIEPIMERGLPEWNKATLFDLHGARHAGPSQFAGALRGVAEAYRAARLEAGEEDVPSVDAFMTQIEGLIDQLVTVAGKIQESTEAMISGEFLTTQQVADEILDLTVGNAAKRHNGQVVPIGSINYSRQVEPPFVNGFYAPLSPLARKPWQTNPHDVVVVYGADAATLDQVRATVELKAAFGGEILLIGRESDRAALESLRAGAVGPSGLPARVRVATVKDMLDGAQAEALFGQVSRELGRPDSVTLFTGGLDGAGEFMELDHGAWQDLVGQFLYAPSLWGQQALRAMAPGSASDPRRLKDGEGRLVVVGPSHVVLQGKQKSPTTKQLLQAEVFRSALRPWTVSVAAELSYAKSGITLNLVLPGSTGGKAPDARKTAAVVAALTSREPGAGFHGKIVASDSAVVTQEDLDRYFAPRGPPAVSEKEAKPPVPAKDYSRLSYTRVGVAEADRRAAGQVVLVVGGAVNMGRYVAERYALSGAKVFIGSENPAQLQEAADAMRAAGLDVDFAPLNLLDPAQIDAFMDAAVARYGRVDQVVNVTGLAGKFGALGSGIPMESEPGKVPTGWKDVLQINYLGIIQIVQRAVALMRAQGGGGRLLNVSTRYADEPYLFRAVYILTKILLKAMPRVLGDALAADGIQIYDLPPALVEGPRYREVVMGGFRDQFSKLALSDAQKEKLKEWEARTFPESAPTYEDIADAVYDKLNGPAAASLDDRFLQGKVDPLGRQAEIEPTEVEGFEPLADLKGKLVLLAATGDADDRAVEDAADRLRSQGADVHVAALRAAEDADALLSQAEERARVNGREFYGLVVLSGTPGSSVSLLNTPAAELQPFLDRYVTAPMVLLDKALPRLAEGGRVALIAPPGAGEATDTLRLYFSQTARLRVAERQLIARVEKVGTAMFARNIGDDPDLFNARLIGFLTRQGPPRVDYVRPWVTAGQEATLGLHYVKPVADRRAEGKVLVVTGGAHNMGRYIAERFGLAGGRVVVVARSESELKKAVDQMRRAGIQAEYAVADVSNRAGIEAALDAVRERYGRIDFLVNNAGIGGKFSALGRGELPFDEAAGFLETLRIDFAGTLYGLRHAARLMAEQGGGRIVNVSTYYADEPYIERAIYTLVKVVQKALAYVLGPRLAEQGVEVLDLSPTLVKGPRMDWVMQNYTKIFEKAGLSPEKDASVRDWFARTFPATAPDYHDIADGVFEKLVGPAPATTDERYFKVGELPVHPEIQPEEVADVELLDDLRGKLVLIVTNADGEATRNAGSQFREIEDALINQGAATLTVAWTGETRVYNWPKGGREERLAHRAYFREARKPDSQLGAHTPKMQVPIGSIDELFNLVRNLSSQHKLTLHGALVAPEGPSPAQSFLDMPEDELEYFLHRHIAAPVEMIDTILPRLAPGARFAVLAPQTRDEMGQTFRFFASQAVRLLAAEQKFEKSNPGVGIALFRRPTGLAAGGWIEDRLLPYLKGQKPPSADYEAPSPWKRALNVNGLALSIEPFTAAAVVGSLLAAFPVLKVAFAVVLAGAVLTAAGFAARAAWRRWSGAITSLSRRLLPSAATPAAPKEPFLLDASWQRLDASSEQGPEDFSLKVRSDDAETAVDYADVLAVAWPEDKVDYRARVALPGRHVLDVRERKEGERTIRSVVVTPTFLAALQAASFRDAATGDASAVPLQHFATRREVNSRGSFRYLSEETVIEFTAAGPEEGASAGATAKSASRLSGLLPLERVSEAAARPDGKSAVDPAAEAEFNAHFAALLTLFSPDRFPTRFAAGEGWTAEQQAFLRSSRLAFLTQEQLRSAAARFNALAAESPEEAKREFAGFASGFLAAAGSSARAGLIDGVQLRAAAVYLLSLREGLTGESSSAAQSDAVRALLDEAAASADYTADESTLRNEAARRGDKAGVYLQVLPAQASDRLASDLAARVRFGEQVMFVSEKADRDARRVLADLNLRVNAILAADGEGLTADFTARRRLIAGRDRAAVVDGLGRYQTDAVYDLVAARMGWKTDSFFMTVATSDIGLWNRSLRPERQQLVQFIVELAGKTVMMLPLMEEQLRAVRVLAIQA
jgi:phosphoenolpyruvate carboxykinase (GTP)